MGLKGNSFDPHWCTDWQTPDAVLECAGKGTTVCSLGGRLKEHEYFTTIFQWQNVFYILLAWVVFLIARQLYRIPYLVLLRGKSQRESEFSTSGKLMEDSNVAVAVSFSGYIVALAWIFCSAIDDLDQGEDINKVKYGTTYNGTKSYNDWSDDKWTDQQGENIWQAIVWASMGLVMLLISRMTNDLLTCGLDESDEIANKGNVASAIMEAGSYVCCGLVVAGSISGRPTSWGADVGTAWIYFAFGQLFYMGMVKQFQYSCMRGWDLIEQIQANNVAAGVAVACQTIAGAIILYFSLYLSTSLEVFGFSLAVGGAALILSRLLADKCILRDAAIADEIENDRNWGAALVLGCAQIASSIMIMSLPASSCDDLSASFSDSLTDKDQFTRIFEYYMLFLLLLIPLMILSVRIMYPLGLMMSGGFPDLSHEDSKPRDAPSTPSSKSSKDNEYRGSGSGVDPSGVHIETNVISKDDAPQEEKSRPDKKKKKKQTVKLTRTSTPGAGDINIDSLLTHEDNKSVAISFSGYLIGIALLWRGTVSATIYDFPSDYDFGDQMKDLLPTLTLLVLGMLCLLLCHVINDKIILAGLKNIKAIQSKSPAVGIVEAGSFIATGQILGAASYGYVDVDDGDSWGEAIFMQFFWFLFGQFILIAVTFISDLINGGKSKQKIKEGNLGEGGYTSAIFLGLRLATAGALVSMPIGKSDSVVTFVVMVPLNWVLCQLGKYLFRLSFACCGDKGEMSTSDIVVKGLPFKTSKNWANAMLEGLVLLAMAQLFGTFLRSCDCYTYYRLTLLS
jgi:uncharacterized membrane protein YjfL (UPF0719 family)